MNLNDVVSEKIAMMVHQSFFIFNKVFQKEKYFKILIGPSLSDEMLLVHKVDLKNNRLSLRIIFLVFDRIITKLSQSLRQDLVDALMSHYAVGDDLQECTPFSKFYSLVAVQIMLKNKTSVQHYEWLVEMLHGLVTTEASVSIQDLITDDFSSENLFEKVNQKLIMNKSLQNQI